MSIAISGSTITFSDLTTQSTAPVVGAGFKNRIYNGDMRIWQRGTIFTNPATTNFYTADRWGAVRAADANGAVVNRIASGLDGFEYALALQRASGNTTTESLNLLYSNESTNTYDLVGSPVTLSFWAKTGSNYSGGPLFVRLRSGTGVDQRVYAYTSLNDFAASTQAITSTWTRYSLTGTVPSSTTELGFYMYWIPTGTAGADDAVKITGVQLEAGSSATDFERRPIGTELALCQRYYETLANDTEGVSIVSYFHLTNVNRSRWFFKATKRATPTVGLVSGTAWASSLVPTIYPSVDNAGFYKTSTNFATSGPSQAAGLYADAEL